MERVSRRTLLATASAGAAVAGVAAVAGPAASAQAAPTAAAPPKAAPLTDHAVARVRDVSTGEVDLFIGQKQVTVRDAALANAIARAAQQHTA